MSIVVYYNQNFQVQESHIWFNKAVARWLDIALYKAMQRIIRAVDLDDLSPVDDLVKHSSSAVDIRTVLMQVCPYFDCHRLIAPIQDKDLLGPAVVA